MYPSSNVVKLLSSLDVFSSPSSFTQCIIPLSYHESTLFTPIFDDIDDYLRSRHRLPPRGFRRRKSGATTKPTARGRSYPASSGAMAQQPETGIHFPAPPASTLKSPFPHSQYPSLPHHGSSASLMPSSTREVYNTFVADSTAQGIWPLESMAEIGIWRADAPTHVGRTPGQAMPHPRPVHLWPGPCLTAGASTMPAPPESTKQKRREVEEEEAKAAPSKPRKRGEYKCQSPGCRKCYKTPEGLENHIVRGVCIPATGQATSRPAPRAVVYDRDARIDSRHATALIQHEASFPAIAPHYTGLDRHPEDFTAQNSSVDAHAMASLQWHSGTPQMQLHQDPQDFPRRSWLASCRRCRSNT
ncbi:hypothetical protein BJ912DRAFT_936875 [Pholiota molesta]|nr:hypothetical protein BJ912DRAFT_936875 [Pholiota molesta]